MMYLIPYLRLAGGLTAIALVIGSPVAEAQTPVDPASQILDEKKQKAIWDAEHVTFEI